MAKGASENTIYRALGTLEGLAQGTHNMVSEMKQDLSKVVDKQSEMHVRVETHHKWIEDWDDKLLSEHNENTDARKRITFFIMLVKFFGLANVALLAKFLIEWLSK